MKCLGVLLCYNDGDLLEESIRYLLDQNHDVVVWDHGSDDDTANVLRRLKPHLIECSYVPRDFDFYELYPSMSSHLLEQYVGRFDWISWPDQDEFLEGPTREKTYLQHLEQVYHSGADWIQFNNLNYWFTAEDKPRIQQATRRIRRYSLFPDCAPRIRSWRASATNTRIFNHNAPLGRSWPVRFNLRHYPMRSEGQAMARLFRDRIGLRRDDSNFHYDNMKLRTDRIRISPQALHYDDGSSELRLDPVFDWRTIYGYPETESLSRPSSA